MRFYTISSSDVGKGIVKTPDGKVIYVQSVIGRVLPCDVGKRLYFTDRIWQAENDEQMAKRLSRERSA